MDSFKYVGLYIFLSLGLGFSSPAHGLTIKPIYENNINSHPDAAKIKQGIQRAIDRYQAEFVDPVTINIQFGWGSIIGSQCTSLGSAGSGWSQGYTLTQIVDLLKKTATSVDDQKAIASLTNGAGAPGTTNHYMVRAQQKVLGLIPANDTGIDSYVCFGAQYAFTYDETVDGVVAPGTYGLVSVALHEISHSLGRESGLPTGNLKSIADLFRFSSPGVRSFYGPESSYFSVDNGMTLQKYFTTTSCQSSWIGESSDSFNYAAGNGSFMTVSEAGLALMDVIGYTRAKAVSSGVIAPKTLTATAGDSMVTLSWAAAMGAVAYNVKVSSTPSGPYSVLTQTSSVSAVDTSAQNAVARYYVVTAIDSNGNESANSVEVSATASAPVALMPPTLIKVGWSSAGNPRKPSYRVNVDLRQSSSAGATKVRIYRKTETSNFAAIAVISLSSNTQSSYRDTAVSRGPTYSYKLTSVDAAGNESTLSSSIGSVRIP